MSRGNASEREVSMTEAAEMLAMTQQGVGKWADQAPPELVKLKRGRKFLIWPGFMVWYRQRLQTSREKPTDFEEARARKMAADAELAELELAKTRGEQIELSEVRKTWERAASRIRAQLLAAPGRYSPRVVGIDSLPAAQRALDAIVRDVLTELKDDGHGIS